MQRDEEGNAVGSVKRLAGAESRRPDREGMVGDGKADLLGER